MRWRCWSALVVLAGFRRHCERHHPNTNISSFADPRGDLPSPPRAARPLARTALHDPGQRRAPQRPDDAWTRRAPNCRITDMVPNLVFTSGATANMQDGLLLHHFVIFNPAQTGIGCPISEPFFGAGNERTHLHLPSPYGYHNTSATWNMIAHLVNKNPVRADGQHRDRVPLAAGRRDRARAPGVARHRLDLQRGELRVHDPDRATPTRTATGPCRRTRASSACPATCTTSTSSTRAVSGALRLAR